MGDEYVPTMLSRLLRSFLAAKENQRSFRLKNQIRAADPNASWDQLRENYRNIGHKYDSLGREEGTAPSRVQPVRRARLEVPIRSGGENSIVREMPQPTFKDDTKRTQLSPVHDSITPNTNAQNQPTTRLSGGESSRPQPNHRYDLRPRPGKFQTGLPNNIRGKRDNTSLEPSGIGEPKRLRLNDPTNSQVPMDISLLSVNNMQEGLQIFVSATLGMFFMLIVAMLLK